MANRSAAPSSMEFSYCCQKSAKPFDRIDQIKLIIKLKQLDNNTNLTEWIESYLASICLLGDSKSRQFFVFLDVPQGIHLRSTLSINGIIEIMGVDVFVSIFVDDVKLTADIKYIVDTMITKDFFVFGFAKSYCSTSPILKN